MRFSFVISARVLKCSSIYHEAGNCSLQHHPGLDLQTFRIMLMNGHNACGVENLKIKTVIGLLRHLTNFSTM